MRKPKSYNRRIIRKYQKHLKQQGEIIVRLSRWGDKLREHIREKEGYDAEGRHWHNDDDGIPPLSWLTGQLIFAVFCAVIVFALLWGVWKL